MKTPKKDGDTYMHERLIGHADELMAWRMKGNCARRFTAWESDMLLGAIYCMRDAAKPKSLKVEAVRRQSSAGTGRKGKR